jgi:nitrogen regulatory protein P-II 1
MKMISSVVRPCRVDAVKRALHDINVVGLTIGEVRDYAPQLRPPTAWMGQLHTPEFSSKIEIRVVVHDDDADEVVARVMRAASTRTTGDGYVCVMPIDHRYSIASGHR